MHIIIIGNGITGVTAARALRAADSAVRVTLVGAESLDHWSRPALMYVYMGHMRFRDTVPYPETFWAKNRIHRVAGWVTSVDVEARTLEVDGRTTLQWDRLLLATGSTPNRFGWPGQDLQRVSGMYSLQDLQALEAWTPDIRHACVVGGGLIGIELAEMLHSRGRHVTLLVRESQYWDNVLPAEEAAMVSRAIRAEGIDLRLDTELARIEDDGDGAAARVVTSKGDVLQAEYVGLTAGVRPNIALAQHVDGVETGRGVLVDRQLRTSAPGVYAAGDCAEIRTEGAERNLIHAVWYTGRMQGEVAAANMLGAAREYDPGIWFNSAKFLDIEYQVYGEVPNSAAQRSGTGPDSVLWVQGDGRRSVRICHRAGTVVGFNLMGVRYRHRVCEQWIAERRSLDYVLDKLPDAAFDPEFTRTHVPQVRAAAGGAR